MTLRENLAREVVLARLGAPPLMIEMPDMTAIDEVWIEKRKALEFVTLEQALSDRLDKNPVGPNVRLYTNWSYLEGIRAEQLSRCNLQAEREALRAEALNSLAWVLGFSEPASTHAIWKTILKSQHHDVYCFSAPELREKAIGWLTEAGKQASQITQQAADALVSHIQTDGVLGQPVVVFSTVPHAMNGLVEIDYRIVQSTGLRRAGHPAAMRGCRRQRPRYPGQVRGPYERVWLFHILAAK